MHLVSPSSFLLKNAWFDVASHPRFMWYSQTYPKLFKLNRIACEIPQMILDAYQASGDPPPGQAETRKGCL